jgi:hypothetical protein
MNASLGHRRLSMIDLAGGHQPMTNDDLSLSIAYNGDIFNHSDLRPALERAGYSYSTPRHRDHSPRLRTVRPEMSKACAPRVNWAGASACQTTPSALQ